MLLIVNMQKFIATWRSVGNSPDLQIDLAGFVRLPAPSKFMTLTPLHLNVPFSMLAPSSGLMLIRVKDHTPHLCFANGISYPYTWAIPFSSGGALTGDIYWFPQNNADEKHNLHCQFMERLHVQIQYVTTELETPFPLTTDNCFCSLEFGIRPQHPH